MSDSAPDLRKEYFETTREEILWRIGHRDQWLKIQLLSQIAIFGLANGVDLGFIKAASPIAVAVAFAFPTSLVLAILYVVEDRLIGLAGAYLGALAQAMPPVLGKVLLPFDASPQLRRYAEEGTLFVRLVGQGFAFLLLPATIVSLSAAHNAAANPAATSVTNPGVLRFSAGCAALVVLLLLWSFFHRRTAGTLDPSSVLVKSWPTTEARAINQFWSVGLIVVFLAGLVAIVSGLMSLG